MSSTHIHCFCCLGSRKLWVAMHPAFCSGETREEDSGFFRVRRGLPVPACNSSPCLSLPPFLLQRLSSSFLLLPFSSFFFSSCLFLFYFPPSLLAPSTPHALFREGPMVTVASSTLPPGRPDRPQVCSQGCQGSPSL